jgi:hypothetical protein
MKLFIRLLLVLGISTLYTSTFAQNTANEDTTKQLYLVTKTDGGEYYGYILSDDGREILLETTSIGKIYINKSDIKQIKKLEEDAEIGNDGTLVKEFRSEGPFTTRYYFTTNAHPIKKKENYALIHLFGPEVHFGVQDNLSLGIMSSWIASPIAVAAKYTLANDGNTGVAVGSIVGSSGYLLNAQGFFGLHWLTLSKGNRKSNISFSAGYGYANTADWISIGDKYTITANGAYDYEAYTAMEDKLYGVNANYEDRRLYQGTVGALVFGLSGITPVGKKASFIFDSMILTGSKNDVGYNTRQESVTYTDWSGTTQTANFTVGEGELMKGPNFTNIVLMPGMRFNTAYDKAFQVALAGLVHIEEGEVGTVPIPMISWLRQF